MADDRRTLRGSARWTVLILIREADVPWDRYLAFSGDFAIKRTISRNEHGSDLALSICELEPGQSTVWRSFIGGDDNPDESGEAVLGDSF